MDLNNITAEQQKGLEFLKVRFMSELEDIKGKIVQLNKPFPDDLTTHLQNSFLNKELLFPPSQQIGLKKDQRKEQLERLKGDENERQYLGRIKLSLEKFAEAGMRQDLENKLLGIVQNPKLTSNKRMSAFFVLMHSLGFGFKRTSDFIVWAFGQMWVYENRRIAKERKAKMKKSKAESKQDSKNKQADSKQELNDNDEQSQIDNQSHNQDSENKKDSKNLNPSDAGDNQSNFQKLQMQQNMQLMDNFQSNNLNNGAFQGSNLGNLDQFSIQQQQQYIQQLPLDGQQSNLLGQGNNLGGYYDGNNSPKNKDLINSIDKKDADKKLEILQSQVNLYTLIQSKQESRIKSLQEQLEEKQQQVVNLNQVNESSKVAFQEFIIQLFQLLQNNNISQDVQSKIHNLAQQHQYTTSQGKQGNYDSSNYEQEINGILGTKKVKTNNQNSGQNGESSQQQQSQQQQNQSQLGGNLLDPNLHNFNIDLNNNFTNNLTKIEPKVEHLQQLNASNSNAMNAGLSNMNNLSNYKNGTNDFQFIQNNLTQGLGLNNNYGGLSSGLGLNAGQLQMNNMGNGISQLGNYNNLLGNDFHQHNDFPSHQFIQQSNLNMGKDQ
ncbi:hypothetical protein PPERSA_03903 [Pseudocohnilembus persalinus]|uniref:Uncharacterized protein n=1 Tax=Pseudocohnilembus persalinus TaxID=266149 RepID=A0A0V0Q957_PSEPJ|nr:hypothetical protein PPERSA_03903 [Pseudocohnilembus persalinus]|eukprot:KRW98768.1 hypothetical protein PPERSA_03903 [Pseudocohnilembus persalinus]